MLRQAHHGVAVGGEVGEQLGEPARGVERTELGAATVGLPQPTDHDPQQRDRGAGMLFDLCFDKKGVLLTKQTP